LVFGIGGFILYPEPTTAEPHATSALNAESTSVLQRAGVNVAAEKLDGFNLLSNTPPVPDIEMHNENGGPVSFDMFKGKVVLFNLWATWCPPCIREMPHLDSLQEIYKDRGFVVVPVASGQQGQEEPAEFLRKRGLNQLTTYYDPYSQFLRTFDLETLPTTFLIDREGNMRGGVIGILDWSSVEAKALIEAFLDEQKT
jgi:thiol-disulfide isomerase/thioredoxin